MLSLADDQSSPNFELTWANEKRLNQCCDISRNYLPGFHFGNGTGRRGWGCLYNFHITNIVVVVSLSCISWFLYKSTLCNVYYKVLLMRQRGKHKQNRAKITNQVVREYLVVIFLTPIGLLAVDFHHLHCFALPSCKWTRAAAPPL